MKKIIFLILFLGIPVGTTVQAEEQPAADFEREWEEVQEQYPSVANAFSLLEQSVLKSLLAYEHETQIAELSPDAKRPIENGRPFFLPEKELICGYASAASTPIALALRGACREQCIDPWVYAAMTRGCMSDFGKCKQQGIEGCGEVLKSCLPDDQPNICDIRFPTRFASE